MRRLPILFVLCGIALAQATFEGQPAVVLSNDKLELTVTLLGGSFAKLVLRDDFAGLNPLWEPVGMARELGGSPQFRGSTGHFVCVDGFGPVSPAERAAGLPGHGEAHLQRFEMRQSASGVTMSAGEFKWLASGPLIQAQDRDGDHYHSIKDPSVVRYGGRWHVFCTIRGQRRSHQIEYLSFADWSQANRAHRETLRLSDAYFCAPQVFYFEPQRKWYLIYQVVDKSRTPALQPAFSTNTDIRKPGSWSKPTLLIRDAAKGIKSWIDFWVICDQRQAHLFFTTLNGEMWRADTILAAFPDGWSQPRVVLKDDIYEASHTYRLKGMNKFLTLVEAQSPQGRRYYKAYLADRLDGEWTPLATRAESAFAAPENVSFRSLRWSDSFSHGELIRDGYDQRLVVNPAKLEFLFQGVLDQDRKGKPYGEIPWRLGILTALGKFPGN